MQGEINERNRPGTPIKEGTKIKFLDLGEAQAKIQTLETQVKEKDSEIERLRSLLKSEQKERVSLGSSSGSDQDVTADNLVAKAEEIIEKGKSSTSSTLSGDSSDASQEVESITLLDKVCQVLSAIDDNTHAELTEEQAIERLDGFIEVYRDQWKEENIEKSMKESQELKKNHFRLEILLVASGVIGGLLGALFAYFISRMYPGSAVIAGYYEALASTAVSIPGEDSALITGTNLIKTPEVAFTSPMKR